MNAITAQGSRGDRCARRQLQAQWPRRSAAAPARPSSRSPSAKASRSRTFATRTAWRPVGNCRACVVEIDGERVLAPSCCRHPTAGMEVHDRQRACRASRRRWCSSCCCPTCPRREYTRHNEVDEWAAKLRCRQAALRAARAAGARPVAPGHRGQPRRLHPVHALPARLPRRAGQRRDRPGVPRRAREDRVRHGRPDGRLHLRGLRRMRAGLPDRRADAGARRGAGRARQAGRFGLPVLRRRLPAHLQRQGQQDPLRRGPRRPGQPRAGCASRAATASTTRTTRSA